MSKKLIYTDSYTENGKLIFPEGSTEQYVYNYFSGRDVRTGESIYHSDQYWEPYSVYDKFFEDNDVLYFIYEAGIGMYEVKENKLSFEEIQKEYQLLKEENLSDEEINKIMMEKYSTKKKQKIKK